MTPKKNNIQPFKVKDCALISQMGGVDSAINLRELKDRILTCPIESLFYHFCETHIRPAFDDPEFSNDLAVWASRDLRDRVLAERLGILNPYRFESLEKLREAVLEIIDERLSEVDMIPWVRRSEDFRFMRAVTAVFSTRRKLKTPQALIKAIPRMTDSTIYYHFIEARRRRPTKIDDFSDWLGQFGKETEDLIRALAEIDFYCLTRSGLRQALIDSVP